MNFKTKKQELQTEFEKNQRMVNQLIERQAQLRGQFQLINELEKDGLSNKENNNVGKAK